MACLLHAAPPRSDSDCVEDSRSKDVLTSSPVTNSREISTPMKKKWKKTKKRKSKCKVLEIITTELLEGIANIYGQ